MTKKQDPSTRTRVRPIEEMLKMPADKRLFLWCVLEMVRNHDPADFDRGDRRMLEQIQEGIQRLMVKEAA